ncbi:MAG: HAMP domain-containing sensor histidine kinase [Actinomycetota bacterium]
MTRPGALRPILLVAGVAGTGAVLTLIVASALGMSGSEVTHLAAMLFPAALTTVAAAILAAPLLARAPFRLRVLSLVVLATVVSLANLGVLSALMLVSHDALTVAVLMVYSALAGVGAAWSSSESFTKGVHQIRASARALATGELSSRVGKVDGGPELQELATSIDEMAERLEHSTASEQRALAVRNDLITAVSHDLRTPLAGLRAMVEAIQDGVVDDPETVRSYTWAMKASVDALVDLIDDLFELVKIDAGSLRASNERARLDEVVDSALALCRPQAIEKGLVVTADLNGADGRLISPRITRALQNLVQNAIRHTPADGTVRVEARDTTGSLELIVEDTGEGIPESAVDRIFEPFWRGDPSRADPGTGLGLTLAQRIVRALDGEIEVRSSPAAGSRFAIRLPLTAASRT